MTTMAKKMNPILWILLGAGAALALAAIWLWNTFTGLVG